MIVRVLGALILLAGCARSATPTRSEPGVAEGKADRPVPQQPKEWSHPKVEARGIWIPRNNLEPATRPSGPRETTAESHARLELTLDQLKAANFNIVLLDTWFKGYLAYPGSKIAPQLPELQGDDILAFLIEESHKRGLQAQLWLGYGFYAYFTPDATKSKSMGAVLDKHPELAAIDSKGRKVLHREFGDYYSLCPSNPKSHEILGQILTEQVTRYPSADGIHLDRIRYPEENFCYCDYCKKHFRTDSGIELKEFTKGSDEAKQFLQWRREQTAKAAAHFKKVVHAVRPGLPITAYVLAPSEMDTKAQGWDLWAKQGSVDILSVSMYGTDIKASAAKALELLGGDRSKLICAISSEKPNTIYLANIEVARTFTSIGQFTWWLGSTAEDDLEGLRAGPYSQPATSPLDVKK